MMRGQTRGQNKKTTLPAWKEIAVFECERRMLNRNHRTEGAERGPLAAHVPCQNVPCGPPALYVLLLMHKCSGIANVWPRGCNVYIYIV